MANEVEVQGFFDPVTNTISYLVVDPASGQAAVVDPVRDFDAASGKVGSGAAQPIIDTIERRGLTLAWVLETHAHADHLSGAPLFRDRFGPKVAIGAGITAVQSAFAAEMGATAASGGGDFDRLLSDGDRLPLGSLEIEVIATPGHTPACVSYLVGDALFVGDTLFMPDYGTARCDFPGGDARTLFHSIQRLLALPPETRVFLCHDYKAPGRNEFAWETTIAEQRARNVHVGGDASEELFVAMRTERDAKLPMPKLLYPAIQTNIRGGKLPEPDEAGRRFIRIPVHEG